jgi:CheY-like chemotaxis protein
VNFTSVGKPLTSYPGRSILILEDDDLARDVARGILRGAGFKVTSARDFHEAIAHIRRGIKIDIALVDVRMPPGTPSGVSFVRLAQSRRPSLKVIFMSASMSSQDFIRFDEGEVFLYKPFAPQHLLQAVTRVAA